MSMTHQLSRRAWLAVAATVLVGLLALAPGAWGTAYGQTAGPSPTPTTQTVTNTNVPTTVTTPTGNSGAKVALNIPAGTFSEPTTVTATPPEVVNPAALPPGIPPAPTPLPGTTTQIAAVFSLDARTATGAQVENFNQPVTITVDIPASVAASIPEGGSVTLARFDEATGVWQQLSCSASGTTLSCETTQFSLWSFIITAPVGATVPGTTTAPSPPDTGDGVFDTEAGGSSFGMAFGIAAAALGLAAAGGLAVSRRRA